MTDVTSLKADPDVLATWVAGWAVSRGLPPPTPAYGGHRIDVGLPDQKARFVFPAIAPGLIAAAEAIEEDNVFLKVCAPPERLRAHLPPAWRIKPVSFMMTVDKLVVAQDRLDGYRIDRRPQPGGALVEILTPTGDLAAGGRVFPMGPHAIFDQIVTHPDHRRRGLGRVVMAALGALAHQGGATRGVLVATPDGRALYQAMGWTLHCLYSTAVRDPVAQDDSRGAGL